MNKFKILLLCNKPVKNADASTITDHLDSFSCYSQHEIFTLSFKRDLPSRINLQRFDAIIIHYSIAIGYHSEHYISKKAKSRIRKFTGIKIVFIQDEYRAVDRVHNALNYMRINILFTCVPEGEIEKVYPKDKLLGLIKVNNLTGYVPQRLLKYTLPSIKDRPIDIGYRSRKLPFWLGELAVEKWKIVDDIKKEPKVIELNLDVSYDEADRIYGKKWLEFVLSCKTMLGVESGASVFDFNGGLQNKIEKYLAEFPDATFEEVQEKFLEPFEGKIYLNQISPRCFESAALKTVMLLYEGEYSNILTPWRHYVPLKKDFSNFSEVVSVLKNSKQLQKIVDCTYREIACNPAYSYQTFIERFDMIIGEQFLLQKRIGVYAPYSTLQYNVHLFTSYRYTFNRLISLVAHKIFLGTFMRSYVPNMWDKLPSVLQKVIRKVC